METYDTQAQILTVVQNLCSFDSTLSTSLNVSCNDKCGCANSLQYNPICGDGVTYFSPCHAGCSRGTSRNNVSALKQTLGTPGGGDTWSIFSEYEPLASL